jgi:hypothetical protein
LIAVNIKVIARSKLSNGFFFDNIPYDQNIQFGMLIENQIYIVWILRVISAQDFATIDMRQQPAAQYLFIKSVSFHATTMKVTITLALVLVLVAVANAIT